MIEELHAIIRQLTKENYSGSLKSTDIDNALNLGSDSLYNDLIKDPMLYTQIQPLNSGMYGTLHPWLEPFRVSFPFTPDNYSVSLAPNGTAPDGVITLPSEYRDIRGIRINTLSNGERRAVVMPLLTNEECSLRIGSYLHPPTEHDPIAEVVKGVGSIVVQMYPSTPKGGVLYYIKIPTKYFADFTVTGRTTTFNPLTSTSGEWDRRAMFALISKAMRYIGVTIEDSVILQTIAQ